MKKSYCDKCKKEISSIEREINLNRPTLYGSSSWKINRFLYENFDLCAKHHAKFFNAIADSIDLLFNKEEV